LTSFRFGLANRGSVCIPANLGSVVTGPEAFPFSPLSISLSTQEKKFFLLDWSADPKLFLAGSKSGSSPEQPLYFDQFYQQKGESTRNWLNFFCIVYANCPF